MGRGLSETQIRILAKINHGRQRIRFEGQYVAVCSTAAILVDLFDFPVANGHAIRFWFGGTQPEWSSMKGFGLYDWDQKTFRRRHIGPRYDIVRASVCRSLTRLHQRELILKYVNNNGHWTAFGITDKGRQWLTQRGLDRFEGVGLIPKKARKITRRSERAGERTNAQTNARIAKTEAT